MKRKRVRGTALVFRNGRVLLVRDRGQDAFSLPGGRRNKGEALQTTAVRELREELGLIAEEAERIYRCDYESANNFHNVTLIEIRGTPTIQSAELSEFRWWDGVEDLPRFAHVDAILRRYRRGTPSPAPEPDSNRKPGAPDTGRESA